MEPVSIFIRKPISISNGVPFVAIRDKLLNDAIRQKRKIRVSTSQKTAVHDPEEWIRTGKKISKVFKIPDVPMILYANYV